MTDESGPNCAGVTLDRMRLVVVQYITEELAKQFAIPAKVEISTMGSFMLDEIVLRVVQEVYGRELERVEVRYPLDWWEAFKDRWFPAWAKARWPVRWKTEQITAMELYPKLAMPDRGPCLAIKYSQAIDGVWGLD